MIGAKNIVRRFGEGELAVTVLKDISITINDGEFVAIIGPSGAGKSTLMYQLSLLDDPTSGEIILDGKNVLGLSQVEKTKIRLEKLGYVFQDYALLPDLTAAENIALPMLMQGMTKIDALAKAQKALERIDMGEKTHNLPSQLSGGQQQRVAIARAIAHNPAILFADEPTANLDSENGQLVMEAFQALHHDGQTIIMVTHEEEYARHAKRVVTLKDGVIISDVAQSGT